MLTAPPNDPLAPGDDQAFAEQLRLLSAEQQVKAAQRRAFGNDDMAKTGDDQATVEPSDQQRWKSYCDALRNPPDPALKPDLAACAKHGD